MPSAEVWLREWLGSKEVALASSTFKRYRTIVLAFIKHIGSRASRSLASVSPRDIQGFLDSQAKKGQTGGSVQLASKILRVAFGKARRAGILTSSPAEAVDVPKADTKERVPFSEVEVKMLVSAAEGELKTLVLLGYFTGARLMDCARMRWSSIDLVAGTLSFVQGKTKGKAVLVPLHPDLQKHLEGLAVGDVAEEYVIPSLALVPVDGGNGVSARFIQFARTCGIIGKGFHSFRHAFTSQLMNAGIPPEIRMRLTGHSSASVHAGYSHAELQTLRDAVSKLPSLAG
jgi:integrase/recombinase XerC